MKNLKTTMSLLALISLIVLAAFKPKNPDYHKLPKALRANFSFVPAGMVLIADDTIQGTAFYLSKTEVSNLQYNNFLNYLKNNGQDELLQQCKIDSTVWNSSNKTTKNPMANYYHQHPAFEEYPVVGISKEGAEAYCAYLNEVLNKNSSNDLIYEVSLPTRAQWIQAAQGDEPNVKYSWGSYSLTNIKGESLGNFMNIGGESIHRNENGELVVSKEGNLKKAGFSLINNPDYTAPITSYYPNSLDIYNMSGNVAELTIEGFACGGSWNDPGYDVRTESYIKYVQPTNTIGFRPILKVRLKKTMK